MTLRIRGRNAKRRRAAAKRYALEVRKCCGRYYLEPHAETCARSQPQCGNKRPYVSKSDARAEAKRLLPDQKLEAYRCGECALYHFGHAIAEEPPR